jgi:hypothetical protein
MEGHPTGVPAGLTHFIALRRSLVPSCTWDRPCLRNFVAPHGHLYGDRGAGTGKRLSPLTYADVLIPIRFQDEIKARRIFLRWQGARREHTQRGLRPASNTASGEKNQRIRIILRAIWN